MVKRLFLQASRKPRRLFLVDSLGAVVSATLYGVVLANLEDTFGMPRDVLYPLALLAGCYALYSGLCYFLRPGNWPPFLKVIALANLTHCLLTIGLAIAYQDQLTTLGYLYFAGEIVIVVGLAALEWLVANRKTS